MDVKVSSVSLDLGREQLRHPVAQQRIDAHDAFGYAQHCHRPRGQLLLVPRQLLNGLDLVLRYAGHEAALDHVKQECQGIAISLFQICQRILLRQLFSELQEGRSPGFDGYSCASAIDTRQKSPGCISLILGHGSLACKSMIVGWVACKPCLPQAEEGCYEEEKRIDFHSAFRHS